MLRSTKNKLLPTFGASIMLLLSSCNSGGSPILGNNSKTNNISNVSKNNIYSQDITGYLYVPIAETNNNRIEVYSTLNGKLSTNPIQTTLTNNSSPTSIAIDYEAKYAYLTYFGTGIEGKISNYSIINESSITDLGLTTASSTPNLIQLALSSYKNGISRDAYALDSSGKYSRYSFNESGILQNTQYGGSLGGTPGGIVNLNELASNDVFGVTMPDTKQICILNDTKNYTVDPNNCYIIANSSFPTAIAFDPIKDIANNSIKYVYIADNVDHVIRKYSYSIPFTGLNYVSNYDIHIDINTLIQGMVIDKTGTYMYVTTIAQYNNINYANVYTYHLQTNVLSYISSEALVGVPHIPSIITN